jgi:RHS repeat-associated protein
MKRNADNLDKNPSARQGMQAGTDASPGTAKSKEEKNIRLDIPFINLPKGGGALKSIDEKFSVNPANGTSSFSIPLPFTEGRNSFTPQLSLSYNSGVGNSAFGTGWNVDVAAIQRKTDKRLPTYSEEDVFTIAGAEDLVPLLEKNSVTGEWERAIKQTSNYIIEQFRPRQEGAFSRIEKVRPKNARFFYWKITTRDNVVTFLGKSASCRIHDPADDSRIFKWLPEISFDDKGNVIYYEYKSENLDNVTDTVFEKNRFNGTAQFINRHIKKISYANREPYYPAYVANPSDTDSIYGPAIPGLQYLMTAVFDYGEHTDAVAEAGLWLSRPDPFSEYRPGFELRTYRLCRRVLMFHHFTELGADPSLVKSLDLVYTPSYAGADQHTEVSYLSSVTSSAYRQSGANFLKRSMPSFEFSYSPLKWNTEVKTILREELADAPAGLSGNYQWVDLWGEGISGMLTEQGEGWFYKSNLGKDEKTGKASFSRAKKVIPKPSFTQLSSGTLQLVDLEANGRKQVTIHMPGGLKGYFEISTDLEWQPLQWFARTHNLDLRDPNVKLIDLTGDGQPDVVLSEDHVFTWYAANGKLGHKAARKVIKGHNEEKGPAVLFSDATQSIFLADMSGDGLTDIVRIGNGSVVYWPNLGYGRFGAKVAMANAPLFDREDQFNSSYIQMVDISGTGATDIVYLGKNKFTAWLNLSGNRWSNAEEIFPFPSTEKPNQVSVIDLLGNGTSCIVWSSPLQKNAAAPMRYIDLMGGQKPHLLTVYKNNLGKETHLEYRSSTYYYLQDKKAGSKWITRLPFPVHCVSRMVLWERINNYRFVQEYAYHHGYYDHEEREFRGFGMVEQTDTEEFEKWIKSGSSNIVDVKLHQPPVKTKTWYHTGFYFNRSNILKLFEKEYFSNTLFNEYHVEDTFIDDSILTGGLRADELRQAFRACKGRMLRKEVYALDGTSLEYLPYVVEEQNCTITLLQPKGGNAFAVFIVNNREELSYHYERNPADPRIAHSLTVEVDGLGNVLRQASVVYRRVVKDASLPQPVQDEQDKLHISFTHNVYSNDVIGTPAHPGAYRLRQVAEAAIHELTGLVPAADYFTVDELKNAFAAAITVAPHVPPGSGIKKRLLDHSRTLYCKDDLTPLPLLQLDSLGLIYESYKKSFTSEMPGIYTRNGLPLVTGAQLEAAGYLKSINYKPASTIPQTRGLFPATDADDDWWIMSGRHGFPANPAAHFYIPDQYFDPLGHVTTVTFDTAYQLHITETTDALGSKTSVEVFNYRTMMPQRVKDINDNISEVEFDTLGMIVGSVQRGKGAEADEFTGFSADLTAQQLTDFINDPAAAAAGLLQRASSRFVYDQHRYKESGGTLPAFVASITRETHFNVPGGNNSKLQLVFEYSDGLGRVMLKKIQAEPGMTKQLVLEGGNYTVKEISSGTALRWVGNGRNVVNNKGKTVKQYDPYFSITHQFENARELVEVGTPSVSYYDAIGRINRVEFPNGSFSKTIFESWLEKKYDTNDTVLESSWYTQRIGGALGVKEMEAAQKAAVHDNTPAIAYMDTLGRTFYSISHNRFRDRVNPGLIIDEMHHLYHELDIEGNQKRTIDARNVPKLLSALPYVPVMSYEYDLIGNRIWQKGMDGGERWMFNDVMNKAVYGWDNMGSGFTTRYDLLNRPYEHLVSLPADLEDGLPARQILYDRSVYGTNSAADKALNLNGKLVRQYDTAGMLTHEAYDFQGNTKRTVRRFLADPRLLPDWTVPAAIGLDGTDHITQTEFDAINRPILISSADGSVNRPVYNQAGLLNEVNVRIMGAAETQIVSNIDYDAKGQRLFIQYGNNTQTTYSYDELTYRLRGMSTIRLTDGKTLQDLRYTYDPVGNITAITDTAVQTVFFNNAIIKPNGDYEYDALYRLVRAQGREHAAMQQPPNESDVFRRAIPLPADELAMQNYMEHYEYDLSGNMTRMYHRGGRGSLTLRWTRDFQYSDTGNQLLSMAVGGATESFSYDGHGQLQGMQHLQQLKWDFQGRLQRINKGGGGIVYYNYDSEGNRVRKVWEKGAGIREDRKYIGQAEVFTRHNGAAIEAQGKTLHIMDDKRRIVVVEDRTEGALAFQLVRFQYNNHLGTSFLEVDAFAHIISYEEYYPFGNTSFQTGSSTAEVNLKRYRYTGKERDEESGFYYNGARYYIPWLARWASPDPADTVDGYNLYLYVNNNPINTHDPTGLWGWRDLAVVAAVVVVGVAVTVATAGAAGPVIAGFAAGALGSGAAATVATGVAVGAVAGAAGGLAGGVMGEVTRQTVNNRTLGLGTEEFSGRRIARAGAEGLVAGAVGGAITGGLGAAATAVRGGTAAARAASTATTTARAASTASRVATVSARAGRGALMGGAGSATGEAARQAVFEGRLDGRRIAMAGATGAAVGGGIGGANVGTPRVSGASAPRYLAGYRAGARLAGRSVPRTGTAAPGTVEVPMEQLRPIHNVPREGTPPGHIENIAVEISRSGYDQSRPVSATRMPNGDLVVTGGHHRLAAMRALGESRVPVKIFEGASTDPVKLAQMLGIGRITGLYETSYQPQLTTEQAAQVRQYLLGWQRNNPGQVRNPVE